MHDVFDVLKICVDWLFTKGVMWLIGFYSEVKYIVKSVRNKSESLRTVYVSMDTSMLCRPDCMYG